MANDGLITSFLGQGLAASRPAAPTIAAGAIAFWWSTDTNQLSAWVEAAWLENILAGSYNDEQAQDAVGTILVDSASIDFTYNDATPSITAVVKAGAIGTTELADTAVVPGAYTRANITVDADGRITAATSGTSGGVWYAGHVPLAADFPTLANAGGTNVTLTDDADTGLLISCGTTGSTDDIRAALKALPAAGSNWTATARITPVLDASGATNGAGLVLRESATDKVMMLGPVWGDRTNGYRGTMTAFSAGIMSIGGHGSQQPWWYRCVYNNAANTYTFYESGDGKNFIAVTAAIAAATAFTTRADQVGMGFTMNSAGKIPILTCDYWVQTW